MLPTHLTAFLLAVLPLAMGQRTGGGPGGAIGAGGLAGTRGQGQTQGRTAGFLITTYNDTKEKQYFTQSESPSVPYILYPTPLRSHAEVFHLTDDNILWYNSTNPELLGPVYSFFYTAKFGEPSQLSEVGFGIEKDIEDPEQGKEYFKWEADLQAGTLEVVYPEDLVFATCLVEIKGLDGGLNEWFVSRQPFTGGELVCRTIEISIEPAFGVGRA